MLLVMGASYIWNVATFNSFWDATGSRVHVSSRAHTCFQFLLGCYRDGQEGPQLGRFVLSIPFGMLRDNSDNSHATRISAFNSFWDATQLRDAVATITYYIFQFLLGCYLLSLLID